MAGMERELARMPEMRKHEVRYGKMSKNTMKEEFEARNNYELLENQDKLLSKAKL